LSGVEKTVRNANPPLLTGFFSSWTVQGGSDPGSRMDKGKTSRLFFTSYFCFMETLFAGIDISKDSFDLALPVEGKLTAHKLPNNPDGFTQLLNLLPAQTRCVMEASGAYYLPLACFLAQKQVPLSVVNPLSVKRFSQMRLVRAKTDKADAKLPSQYGQSQQPPLWQPKKETLCRLAQLQALLQGYIKHRTALLNQKEAFEHSGVANPVLYGSLEKMLENLQEQIQSMEKEMEKEAKKEFAGLLDLLLSIPGIGKKTAIALCLVSEGFTRFDTDKQLAAYIGMAPRIFESGTSVKGKSHICKLGMGRIRRLLYLCSWQACSKNKACRHLYERLLAKGKARMVALVAVARKLLSQAFAIAKSKRMYDENFALFP
jgi:transposase